MLDPAIEAFFIERKEGWLKKNIKASMSEVEISALKQDCDAQFSLSSWLPNAAKRAGQISISTHPCTFSHPSARRNKNGTVNATIANAAYNNDGFLRSGNVKVEPDALGNAAALDVYKFLTLEMQDKQTLLEHIKLETELAKKLLGSGDEAYAVLRDGFLDMTSSNTEVVTSSKIKQVYFPVWVDDADYHLLSPLTPSALLFELRRRIDSIRFSEKTKTLRELKRKNEYSKKGFQEIYGVTTIGFGGTKPQNISVLNNQNAGKAHLLSSLPPVIKVRETKLPKTHFFSDVYNPWHIKETYVAFHALISKPQNHKRQLFIEERDKRIQEYIDYILMMMWRVRRAFEQNTNMLPQGLLKYQQTWLFPQEQTQRDNMDDWLLILIEEIARKFVDGYKVVIGNKAIALGNEELDEIVNLVLKNKELLR